MGTLSLQFAETAAEGISSLGINLKSFIFQLVTFVIVLLILRRWVFPKIVATLETRRETLEESLIQAKKTEEALNLAEEEAAKILHRAREQADQLLAEAAVQAKESLAKAESEAAARADRIVEEANQHIAQERSKLRGQLKNELTDLVILTSEKVLRKKLNRKEDAGLVEAAIGEIGR